MKIIQKFKNNNNSILNSRSVTIAFLGDSVTQGCFELIEDEDGLWTSINDYEAVYHARIKKMLHKMYPEVPVNIINSGIGGTTAKQGLERLERDVLSYKPDLTVVCFGLNDSGMGIGKINEYTLALEGIFIELENNNIEIIFLTPNMMNTYVSPLIEGRGLLKAAKDLAKVQNEGIMDSYMEAAKEVCSRRGVQVCDCYSKWKKMNDNGVDTTKLLSNRINHPDREMHKMFAQDLLDTIMFS